MPRSILVSLDGAESDAGPVELALDWAGHFDALLVALGVIDEESLHANEPVPLGAARARQQLVAAHRREALLRTERALSQFAIRCAERQVACKLLEDVGDGVEQIQREAQRYDVIVVGRAGFRDEENPAARGALERLLKAAPRPVVSVPASPHRGSTIVVAYDGSLPAARTAQALFATGLHDWKPLHVVSVHDDRVEAAKCAERAVEFFALHGIRAEPHALRSEGPVDQTLCAEAERLDAGLVAMGAYGRPALREFFLGSVTRRMLAACSRPLLMYH